MTYIYGLTDPRTGEVRYVGKADNPVKRLKAHLMPCYLLAKSHKNTWIKSLLVAGYSPGLVIIEEVVDDWQERESFWISRLSNLTNGAPGGHGGTLPGKYQPAMTDDQKRHLSEFWIGKSKSAETRAKMSSWQKGLSKGAMPDLQKAKIGEANRLLLAKLSPDERRARTAKAVAAAREKSLASPCSGCGIPRSECDLSCDYCRRRQRSRAKQARV